jgi:lycopene cyclase domain-containing protein
VADVKGGLDLRRRDGREFQSVQGGNSAVDTLRGGSVMLEYMGLMLIFTVPFIAFAVHRRRITALGKAAVMGLVIGVPWDTISAGYYHTWFWRRTALLGVYIGPLPVEEYLFMMLVPMMLIGAALLFRIDLYLCSSCKKKTDQS